MKIRNGRLKPIILVTLFSLVFCPGISAFSQEKAAVETPAVQNAEAGNAFESGKNFTKRMNGASVQAAALKHKPMLVAGGIWGFIVWILLLLNSFFFLGVAIAAWSFIRRHRTYPKKLVHRVKSVLYDGELGFAMEACSPCNTPLSRILFSSFKNVADGFEVCKDEMHIALKAEYERMLKTTRMLLNCAVYSAVLGFLGAGLVLFKALREFSENSRLGNFQELAFVTSQCFYPMITGLIIAYIAFWFHRYCVGKVNRIIINTEKIAYDLIKVLRGIRIEGDLPDLPTMTRLLNPRSIVSLSKGKIIPPKNKAETEKQ
ncbi:MAG: MotA/TolQ/ExbB proton channel family protein [Victivallales bacterium]|nr:MotA/TolQ/ExbB proton channel family protein [Victivallales bacterium]